MNQIPSSANSWTSVQSERLNHCDDRVTDGMRALHRRYASQQNCASANDIRCNPNYVDGLKRLQECIRGCFAWIDIGNFQFHNMLYIIPTTVHLFFPDIIGKRRKEIQNALGLKHRKKGVIIIAGRGWGKTFLAVAWIVNAIRVCKAPFVVAILGQQQKHSANVLSMARGMMEKHKDCMMEGIDGLVKNSVLCLQLRKGRKLINIDCYPGKGEKFRGDNTVKMIIFDEFFFADPIFIQQKYLPHLQRYDIGSINLTTPRPENLNTITYSNSNEIFEVVRNEDIPEMTWLDSESRLGISKLMDEQYAQTELYARMSSNQYKLFDFKALDLFVSAERAHLKFRNYVASIDPNQEGSSENAIAILGYNTIPNGMKYYRLVHLHSFCSNQYSAKIDGFVDSLQSFRDQYFGDELRRCIPRGAPPRYNVFVFVESNNGNVGKDISDGLCNFDDSLVKFYVMRAKNWNEKERRYLNFGFAKTSQRTKNYANNFSKILEGLRGNSRRMHIDSKLCTNLSFEFNSVDYQVKKLRLQLGNFRNRKGVYTGKYTDSGVPCNDDLAVALLSAITMETEMNETNSKLMQEVSNTLKVVNGRPRRRSYY